MKKFLLGTIILLAVTMMQAQSNLTVTSLVGQHVDTVLKHHVEGEGVVISNGKFNNQTGNISSSYPQIGTFNRNNFTNFPFATGIVLTTGNVSLAAGPNSSGSATSSIGNSYYTESALSSYSGGYSLTSCASLEFDFIAMADTFAFNYIFASEEYCEYVNTSYNDVFGFILTGGIDPVTYLECNKNVAIVPGTISTPVSISTVNHGQHSGTSPTGGTGPSNSSYFICNCGNVNGVQYDGYTTVLSACATIFGCNTYHMKLAICNVSDPSLDSGVFIEEGSFYSPKVQVEQNWETEVGGDTLIQNCRNLDLDCTIEHPFITGYTSINIDWGGDAVMGTDYSVIVEQVSLGAFDTLTVDNNSFFYQPGDTVMPLHVRMLPSVQFSNPDQVKTAVLYIRTQGCDGFPDLMDRFVGYDTIVLHLRANDSVRLRDTTFTACDTLKYIEVEKVRGSNSVSYVWFNNAGDTLQGVANPESIASACELTQSGIYKLYAHDPWHCMTDTATVEVSIVPRPEINITYTPDHGCQPLPVTWQAQYSPDYATLLWNIYNDSTYSYIDSAVTLHTSLADEGYYTAKLTVTTAPGCYDSLVMENVVHVAGYPHADFTFSPSEPENGEEVFFFNLSTGTNITNYSWNFGDGHSSYVEEPSHAYHLQESDLMTVRLMVTNSEGCSDDTIQVVPVEDNYAFYVPSGFTPNTDGMNEIFLPRVNDVVNYEFFIFARNGEIVFYTNNPDTGWDGTFGGKPAPQGVYLWKINYARIGTPDEMMVKTGTVTLIR